MRIFYAAGASPNAVDISESRLWDRNLHDSLVEMGHEVIRFGGDVTRHFTEFRNYQSSPAERNKFLDYKRTFQSALLGEIAAEHRKRKIDLFFSYFWSDICDPETIDKIKERGISTVNWFCNASYQFHLVAELAPRYDWNLVPEKFRLKDYADAGARAVYCQEAANPAVYRPYDLPKEYDVTFVGQAYGDRSAYIRYLLDHGIDVRVWGPGWRNYDPEVRAARMNPVKRAVRAWRRRIHPPIPPGASGAPPRFGPAKELPSRILGGVLSDEDMIRMYSRSRINLGFSTCGDTHKGKDRIVQVRLRDFEVPMSGGFYMVESMVELDEFFDTEREIVCYTGPVDLAEKIKYYLRNEDERNAIAAAGMARCRRDHTWRRRFEKAFGEMGLTG